MQRRSAARLSVGLGLCAVTLCALPGCRDRPVAAGDAAADRAGEDATRSDGTVAPLEIDFTATGCPDYDLAESRCSGKAPLTVSFAPIASASVTRFLWDFGDGTPKSSDRAPTHTYVLPGSFAVTLVGAGTTGTVSRVRRQFVVATVASVGWPCDVDAQCATGLRCFCGSASPCGGEPRRGFCTVECGDGSCADGARCAAVPLTAPADAGAATGSTPLCLAPCEADLQCAPGLGCRWMPGVSSTQPPWVQACFAATPAPLGASCRAASGQLDPPACISGRCDDLGALGLCVATCAATEGCPAGNDCARLRDGRSLCLRTCADSSDCGRDPLIGCEPPGSPGALGFSLLRGDDAGVPPGDPASTVCAPKGCAVDDDCGPSGACRDGHCTRREAGTW